MGALLGCFFSRNAEAVLHEGSRRSEAEGASARDDSEGGDEDAQLFDCAFIAGVCQDQEAEEKKMVAFTRDQYPQEVIANFYYCGETTRLARRLLRHAESISVSPSIGHWRIVFPGFGVVANTNTKSGKFRVEGPDPIDLRRILGRKILQLS